MEKKKRNYNRIAFWVCLSISIFLMVGGALTPPPFVVDKSIFTAVGWLFAFAALSQVPVIIDSGKNATITRGNTQITITDDTPDNNQESEKEEIDEQVL